MVPRCFQWDEGLRKIVPRGNTGGDVRTIAGPWEGRRGLEERLATKSPTLELKAVEALELWLQSSTQVAKSPSRQVAKSPVDVTLPAKGPARGLG